MDCYHSMDRKILGLKIERKEKIFIQKGDDRISIEIENMIEMIESQLILKICHFHLSFCRQLNLIHSNSRLANRQSVILVLTPLVILKLGPVFLGS